MSKSKAKSKELSLPDMENIFRQEMVGQVEREKAMQQIMYAILTGEHVLLKGPPGTGKSQLAMNAFALISDADVFSAHLTKQTTEEYVFGPMDIDKLRRGIIEHNTDQTILTADFAFLDELFDASDVLLRSLLGVLNERRWTRGRQEVNCPLRTAILTSNYTRENEMTEALVDRILFKCNVGDIRTMTDRVKVYSQYINGFRFQVENPPLRMTDLDNFRKKMEDPNSVSISRHILHSFDTVIQEFTDETKSYVSQRTRNKLIKVIKASALLHKRDEAILEDIKPVGLGLCEVGGEPKDGDPDEESIFEAVYDKFIGTEIESRAFIEKLEEFKKDKIEPLPKQNELDKLNLAEFQDSFGKMYDVYKELCTIAEGAPEGKARNKADKLRASLNETVQQNTERVYIGGETLDGLSEDEISEMSVKELDQLVSKEIEKRKSEEQELSTQEMDDDTIEDSAKKIETAVGNQQIEDPKDDDNKDESD